MFKKWAIQTMGIAFLFITHGIGLAQAAPLTSVTNEFRSENSAGMSRTEEFVLRAPPNTNARCLNFEKAELKYTQRRYSHARIRALPSAGCKVASGECKVQVAWEQAPAGRLGYYIEAHWSTSNQCN